MAPALTQTAEPPNLADAAYHSPDSNTTTTSPYDNLKELSKSKSPQSTKTIFDSEQILLSNGDCASSGLAPPAFGWAEGRPVPNTLPCRSNMDDQPPLPLRNSGNICIIPEQPPVSPSISSNSNMGLQSYITNIDAASTLISKGTEAATTTTLVNQEDSNAILNNQNELLALVGRDFDNVNDIIDTLQRLASNPELLDAAARDLEPEATPQNVCQIQTPEDRAASVLGRLAERQRQLERRRLFLLRRLRRVTARGLGMTVSSQLSHLTRHVKAVLEDERAKQPNKETKGNEPIGLEMLHKESMKNMSTSDLISLVRRVEASNNLQRLNDAMSKKNEVKEVLSLPSSLCAELDTVASEMRAATLAHVAHDSDATESSSGGESCDEAEAFSNINSNYKPIRERAFYRYCRTRGWVASNWLWLQAQIADLDYKILQQQKLHTHIQKSKGAVQLAEDTTSMKSRGPPSRGPAHFDMQDPALTCVGSALPPKTILNGYHPSNKTSADDPTGLNGYANAGGEVASGCARTLGTERVKRRRYVKPNMAMLLKRSLGGTSNSTNKVNRVSSSSSSSVFCKCIPPLVCIICIKFRTSSRNNISFGNHVLNSSKMGAIALFNQSVLDKLSKVDQSFHPILSRNTEMLQGELYNTILKSSEWQQKALVRKPSHREEMTPNSINHFEPLTKKKKDKEHKRNGRKKHARDDGKEKIALKIKKCVLSDATDQEKDVREMKRRKIDTRNSHVSLRRSFNDDDAEDGDDELNGLNMTMMGGSAYSSPCQSPALVEKGEKEGGRARKYSIGTRHKHNATNNSYDINNIVIPYSMAATSRVEMIQYKEIPTPKWRIEDIRPMSPSSEMMVDEDEGEDVSLDATLSRHSRSEETERKKFLKYLQTQVNSSRSTRTRRADSSGTNTPDHPLSPRLLETLESSPVGSPPDTPSLLGPNEDSNHSSLGNNNNNNNTAKSTVISLSLSSIQSSLLKSNPPPPPLPPITSEGDSSKALPPSSSSSTSVIEGGEENPFSSSSTCVNISSFRLHKTPSYADGPTKPGFRTRRILGGCGSFEKLRSTSVNEESEHDRVSPFPCREFPLAETEYEELVCEDECMSHTSSVDTTSTIPSSAPTTTSTTNHHYHQASNQILNLRQSLKEDPVEGAPSQIGGEGEEEGVEEDPVEESPVATDVESGRESPLSEVTDSAPEEEGSWDDGAAADWTISAVNDRCGGFVMTVHRN